MRKNFCYMLRVMTKIKPISKRTEKINANPVARRAIFHPLSLYVTLKIAINASRVSTAYRTVKDIEYSPMEVQFC